ncbi:MAG TPA: DUF6801 domain-containing protein [Pseudonocardiaceae bacterium]|jgi:hypothetical protein|nr:DUF6801 domain-containing protein [Pseudonocardiaceae bacterium]
MMGVVGAVAALLGTGIASAAVPVDQFLNWNGNFPIIGNLDPITTETVTSLPSPVTVGTASANFPVSVKIDAPPLATTGLETVGAASTSGSAQVTVRCTDSAGATTTETINLTIPATATPPNGSDFVVTATGSANIPPIANAGNVTCTVLTPASTTLSPVDANGNPTILGTFTVTLNQDATGPSQNPTNNPTLGTIVAQ